MTDQPFDREPPQDQDRMRLRDYPGCGAIFFVGGVHQQFPAPKGPKTVVRCSVVLLNGPEANREFTDVVVFNSKVVSALRQKVGKAWVGHIEVDGSSGQPVPYLLEADDNEFELAMKWHDADPARYAEMLMEAPANFRAQEALMRQPQPQQQGYGQQQQWGQQPDQYGYGQPQQQWASDQYGQQQQQAPRRSTPGGGPARSAPPPAAPPPPSAPPAARPAMPPPGERPPAPPSRQPAPAPYQPHEYDDEPPF